MRPPTFCTTDPQYVECNLGSAKYNLTIVVPVSYKMPLTTAWASQASKIDPAGYFVIFILSQDNFGIDFLPRQCYHEDAPIPCDIDFRYDLGAE